MKYMKENDSGSIINISSVEGHKPDKGLGVYSISKAAISMLTKSQAKEWGKYGIRSNAICPGLIKTKLSSALWQNEEMLEIWLKDLQLEKLQNLQKYQEWQFTWHQMHLAILLERPLI